MPMQPLMALSMIGEKCGINLLCAQSERVEAEGFHPQSTAVVTMKIKKKIDLC